MRIKRSAVAWIAAAALVGTAPGWDATAADARAASATRLVRCRPANRTCWITAFAFSPARTLFYVERFTGHVRRVDLRTGTDTLLVRLGRVTASGANSGVLGLALHPRWFDQPWVYVSYTRRDPTGSGPDNLLLRLRRERGGTFRRQILLRYPEGRLHNLNTLAFGPDGRLYAAAGDRRRADLAQRIWSPAGKMLRLSAAGRVPRGNPFSGRFTWSFGHRNSFGFAFDPRTGSLWETENGRTCTDEVNRIERARNYGWGPKSFPREACPNISRDGPAPIPPAWSWEAPIAPTGAAFCERCGLGADTEGTLLVASWNEGTIRRLTLSPNRRRIVSEEIVYRHDRPIIAVQRGRKGAIFFSDPTGIYRLEVPA
ncbi:MAG: PQQ-dependent sugar dehydrogenase [Actinomycetota bacterium]|nr:PQQ-dependent sugar dehydrogenase [Actinomycetota bacterium]